MRDSISVKIKQGIRDERAGRWTWSDERDERWTWDERDERWIKEPTGTGVPLTRLDEA